jgi:TM2 domain-containing membrane protein YozV
MNCANHPDVSAVAFCRECGIPVCGVCERQALGSVYCPAHVPGGPAQPPLGDDQRAADATPASSGFAGSPYATQPGTGSTGAGQSPPHYSAPSGASFSASASPYTASAVNVPDPGVHPVLALILGFLPGVGAIYNGQYAKGLVHAVIFGLLVSFETNVHNGGMAALIGVMISVWVIYQAFEAYHTARKRRYGMAIEEFSSLFEIRSSHTRFPAGALILIGVGFILLLDTTDIISLYQVERYWPLALIVAGLYLLYVRLNPPHAGSNGNGNAEVRR